MAEDHQRIAPTVICGQWVKSASWPELFICGAWVQENKTKQKRRLICNLKHEEEVSALHVCYE